MKILITLLFIIITILSIVNFGLYGLLILLLTIPLLIIYYKSSNIIDIFKKKKNKVKKDILLNRKEVEVVSSRDRKKAFILPKKKKNDKKMVVNNSRKRKDIDTNKRKKKIGKKILTICLSIVIFFVFVATIFMIYIVISTGSFDPNALVNQDQTVLYDKDGEAFASLGAQKRESVTFDELPQVLIDAVIATEDSRYYQHNGVDMARFLKASALQALGKSDAGGASTLTMQVVKNNLTDTSSDGLKGIIRKFKDVYLSVFFMEKKFTKEEIIEFYVNDSCLGGNVYGVEEASKYYFGKTVSELTLPEAALLAGMYQAPNRYNPYKNPEAAAKRRKTVLSLMVRHGYITQDEADMANDVDITSMLAGATEESDYQGYVDTVVEEVLKETKNDPYKVPMKIYTALDREVQDGINNVLSGKDHDWPDDFIQAGVVVTNVNDGTIIAIGAGRNRQGERTFNYATQAHRQPGSTAKPLFDYGPGFEYNDFSTYTLFNDESWAYTNGPTIGNWDGGFEGLITLRRALSYSRNIPALKAFQIVDTKNIVNFVNGLGLDMAYSTKSDNYKEYGNGANNLINEAYSIGGASYGFTPLQMAEAYSCYANGGYHIESHTVTKIEYRNTGEITEITKSKEKVMSDSTAYLMNNVLQYAVEYGFNGGARVYGSTVAAKTGTSNLPDSVIKKYGLPGGATNDLWTVAYTPELSISLWYGYEEVSSEHYLSSASAPKDEVMRKIMKYIPKTTKKWEMPSSVVAVTIEKETWPAQLPSEYTPDDMKITEYFKKGTQPTEVSERYSKLSAVTNLKSVKTTNGYKLSWTWKVPNVLDTTYLNKYFSNYVFGNGSSYYLGERIKYNDNVLGGNGFGIYKKTTSGGLERIDFTTKTEYEYVPVNSEDVEFVIKAEYKSFKDNASDGTSIKLKIDANPNPAQSEKLEIELKDKSSLSITKGNYTESGVIVKYDGAITAKATITYKVNNTTYTLEKLEEYINTLDVGTYEITYTASYNGETDTVKRTITIISN